MLRRYFTYFFFLICSFGFSVPQAQAVYNSNRGRWMTRDHRPYIDGSNLLAFVSSNPIQRHDSHGFCGDHVLNQSQPNAGTHCTRGFGWQNPASTDVCDVACTAACGQTPATGTLGVTICDGPFPVACVCTNRIAATYSSTGIDCFRSQLAQCVLAHELTHSQFLRCPPSNTGIISPYTPGGLPWNLPCDGLCSECDAYTHDELCVASINCSSCAEPAICEMAKALERAAAVEGQNYYCWRCSACKRLCGSGSATVP